MCLQASSSVIESRRPCGRAKSDSSLLSAAPTLGSGTGICAPNALFFSPKRQRILGHEEGEIGQRYEEWESRLHPDDRDRAQATIRDYLQGKITE